MDSDINRTGLINTKKNAEWESNLLSIHISKKKKSLFLHIKEVYTNTPF